MRIGLIGLGRIGAFHADTLAGLDHVDELVVTDPVAAAVEAVTGRIGKATAVVDPDALLASAGRGKRGRLKIFLGMAPGVGDEAASR